MHSDPKQRGIRPKGNRLEANVNIHGQRYSRTFPPDTPLEKIQDWRENHPGHLTRWRASERTDRLPQSQVNPAHFRPSLKGWCYLYIIRCDSAAKIGRCLNLKVRINELQTGSPVPLILIGAAPAHASLEVLVHEYFKKDRLNGEWFNVTIPLLRFASHLRSGKNPLTFFWPGTKTAVSVPITDLVHETSPFVPSCEPQTPVVLAPSTVTDAEHMERLARRLHRGATLESGELTG